MMKGSLCYYSPWWSVNCIVLFTMMNG